MNKQWFIGTSGFMTSQKTWLDLPGLNCIEVNSTFYSLPSKKTVNNWKILDPNLYFSLKVSKYITHLKRLKNCKGAWDKFWNRVKPLGKKLKALLIQLPPSFKYNSVNLERIEKMAKYGNYVGVTNHCDGGLEFFSENPNSRYRSFFAAYPYKAFYPQNTPKIRKNRLTCMVPETHMATLGHFNMTF